MKRKSIILFLCLSLTILASCGNTADSKPKDNTTTTTANETKAELTAETALNEEIDKPTETTTTKTTTTTVTETTTTTITTEKTDEEIDFSKTIQASKVKYSQYLEEKLGSETVAEGIQIWDSAVSVSDVNILVSMPIDLSGDSENQAAYLVFIMQSICEELKIPVPDFGESSSNDQIIWSFDIKTDEELLNPRSEFYIVKK